MQLWASPTICLHLGITSKRAQRSVLYTTMGVTIGFSYDLRCKNRKMYQTLRNLSHWQASKIVQAAVNGSSDKPVLVDTGLPQKCYRTLSLSLSGIRYHFQYQVPLSLSGIRYYFHIKICFKSSINHLYEHCL